MSVKAVVISKVRSKKESSNSSNRLHFNSQTSALVTATMFAEFADRKNSFAADANRTTALFASSKCTICIQCHRRLTESITLKNCNHQFCLACFNNYCRLKCPSTATATATTTTTTQSICPIRNTDQSQLNNYRYVCYECNKNHSMTKIMGTMLTMTTSRRQANRNGLIATNAKTVTTKMQQRQQQQQQQQKNGYFVRKTQPVPVLLSVRPNGLHHHHHHHSFSNHILMNISQNFFEPIQKFACNRNGLLPIRKIKPIYVYDIIYEYPLLNVVNSDFRSSEKSAFVNMQIENVPKRKPSVGSSSLAKLMGGNVIAAEREREREPKRPFRIDYSRLLLSSPPPADFTCFSHFMQKLLPSPTPSLTLSLSPSPSPLPPPSKRLRHNNNDIFETKEHHYFLRPKKRVNFALL